MRTIPFSELHKVDFTLSDILALPQFWHDGSVYSFAERARPNHGVMFFTGSSAVYTGSDGSRCAEASPTDVVYVPKGVRYTVAFSGNDDKAGTSNYLINFILTDKNGEEFALSDGVTVYSEAFSDTLCEKFAQLSRQSMTAFHPPCRVKAALYDLLCDISQSLHDEEIPGTSALILPATTYIAENYLSSGISVKKLAEISCMSEANFRRVFEKSVGMPPKEYVLRLKFGTAATLLEHGGYTVEKAARYVGFDDPSYFVRIYKKYMGNSPGKEKHAALR